MPSQIQNPNQNSDQNKNQPPKKESFSLMTVKTLLVVLTVTTLATIIIGGGYIIGGYYKTQNNKNVTKEPFNEWKICNQDSDCVGIRSGCTCYIEDAINKIYLNNWTNILQERCGDKCMMDLRFRLPHDNIVNKAVCENNRCEIKQEKENQVSITTDKTEYEQGEMVEIIVENNTDKSIRIHTPLLGIKQFDNNNWVPVKMVLGVCGGPGESVYNVIEPYGVVEYNWYQEEKSCDISIVTTIPKSISKQVSAGKYRIKSIKVDLNNADDKQTIYSNEFTIKEKLALDARCGEKVEGIGDCSMKIGDNIANETAEIIGRVGYEFNSITEKCVKKVVGGCSFEIPFETLEECQEVCKKDKNCMDEDDECTVRDIDCCDGLKKALLIYEKENEECGVALPCGSICIPCGNGICDRRENKCNCPEDCEDQLDTSDWQTYQNEEFGFEVKYPSKFKIEEIKNQEKDNRVIISSQLFLLTIDNNPNNFDLKTWYNKEHSGGIGISFENAVKKEEVNIGENSAIILIRDAEGTYEENILISNKKSNTIACFKKSFTLWTDYIDSWEDLYNENEQKRDTAIKKIRNLSGYNTFNQILSTFKFIEK